MDTAKRFFRKYLFSSMMILMVFVIINLLLVIGIVSSADKNSISHFALISQIAEGISSSESGKILINEDSKQILVDKSYWAMILNDNGKVIWDYDLPEELPKDYTATDIAKFTRWYLKDYPVLVQEIPSGLLVVGCPKGSCLKLNYITNNDIVKVFIVSGCLILAINILLVVLLFWRNTRKVEKATTPIISGIEKLAHGKYTALPENGDLAEINSELNKAGEYINNRDKARAEWINGVSHDIRTPLSIILGYAGEMEDNTELPETSRNQAAIIRTQGEKLRRLIADLNLTSKLEYSMEPLKVKTVYPVELARQVITEFLNNGLEDKYPLDFDFQYEEAGTLEGDESLLMRMLTNLIQNSISHNPKGCHITVGVHKNKDSWEFAVGDNGVGISEKQLKDFNTGAFKEKAYKENGETAHGFGLRLVSQIVKVHGGTIHFESCKPSGVIIKIQI